MESNPKGCGRVYRILSSSPTWRSEFGHVRRRAVLRDLEELGGRGSWGNHVDIWSPSDVRGNGVPLMSADVGEGEVRVVYYGGGDGALLRRLHDLVETWRQRYSEPELRIVEE